MSKSRKSFSFGDFLTAFFLFILITTPLLAVMANAIEGDVSLKSIEIAIIWLVIFTGSFFYARKLCSSEKLSYWHGLKWAVGSASNGWWGSFVFLMPPAFVVSFLCSILIALYCDMSGKREKAPFYFNRLIHIFYRNRLRQ